MYTYIYIAYLLNVMIQNSFFGLMAAVFKLDISHIHLAKLRFKEFALTLIFT